MKVAVVLGLFAVLAVEPASSACVSSLTGIGTGVGDSLTIAQVDAVVDNVLPYAFLPLADPVIGSITVFETPIQFRLAYYVGTSTYDAAAAFHPTALETYGRTTISEDRRRCPSLESQDPKMWNRHAQLATMYTFAYSAVTGNPASRQAVADVFTGLGLDYSLVEQPADISTPWGLAKAIVEDPELVALKASDGWNADGSLANAFNKMPYKDYAVEDQNGDKYEPYEVNRWAFLDLIRKVRRVWSKNLPWQPLSESDGLGYFTQQEHVTPHIGFVARLFGLTEDEYLAMNTGAPNYDYVEEVEEALERTRVMATDDSQKMLIEYYDSKFTSILPLQIQWSIVNGLSLFDFWKFDAALVSAMYDATVLVWRKKVEFNSIRPPTIVHALKGGLEVNAYAGPFAGAALMDGADWQPYVRTMPHAEFPSGSACVCQAFGDTITALSGSDNTGIPLQHIFPVGSSRSEPGVTPAAEIGLTYTTWSSIVQDCGESRLFGGMHFRASVPAGYNLCDGIAAPVVARFELLTNGDPAGAMTDITDPSINVLKKKKGNRKLRV